MSKDKGNNESNDRHTYRSVDGIGWKIRSDED